MCILSILSGVFGSHCRVDGFAVNPAKVKAVQEWNVPTSVIEIRSFLGLAGYYKRFILQFAKIAALLTNLMRKNTPFTCSLR